MKDDPNRPLIVRLFSPIPPCPEKEERGPWHGGLKVDWRSEVGRTGDLLDWVVPVRSVDGGMPPDVARILAVALCASATVVGCTLDVQNATDPEWTAVPGGHTCLFRGRQWLGSGPPDWGLMASRNPNVVTRFFDDDDFPWFLEGQLLFLCPPGTLPRLDRALVEACFSVPIRATLAQLADAGVTGLVRAGVDGDVAGLYTLTPEWRGRIVRALADAVAAAGARWEEHDGAEHGSVRARARPG